MSVLNNVFEKADEIGDDPEVLHIKQDVPGLQKDASLDNSAQNQKNEERKILRQSVGNSYTTKQSTLKNNFAQPFTADAKVWYR